MNKHIILATDSQILALNPRTGYEMPLKADDKRMLDLFVSDGGIFHAVYEQPSVIIYDSFAGSSIHSTVLPSLDRKLLEALAENLHFSISRDREALVYDLWTKGKAGKEAEEVRKKGVICQRLNGIGDSKPLFRLNGVYGFNIDSKALEREVRVKNKELYKAHKKCFAD